MAVMDATAQLHTLLWQDADRYHRGGRAGFQKTFDDLLAQGVDFARQDKDGDNAFQLLMKGNSGAHKELCNALVDQMIAAGGNPLAGEGRYFKDRAATGAVVYSLMDSIAKQQGITGKVLTDELGNNVMHLLAQQDQGRMRRAVRRLKPDLVSTYDSLDQTNPTNSRTFGCMAQWARLARKDGSTPLHVLWHEDTLRECVVRERNSPKPEEQAISHVFIDNWNTTLKLFEVGASVTGRNKQGEHVAGLIDKAMDAYQMTVPEITKPLYEKIQAQAMREHLDTQTPGAGTRGRLPGRL